MFEFILARVALIRLYILIGLGLGTVVEGFAPRYAAGVMERVSRHRDLPIVSCMVSSPYYDIGEWVYIWGVNTHTLRWCRVTDVSGPKDRARHLRTRRVVELGYNEAISLCGKAHMADPPTKCPVIVFRVEE